MDQVAPSFSWRIPSGLLGRVGELALKHVETAEAPSHFAGNSRVSFGFSLGKAMFVSMEVLPHTWMLQETLVFVCGTRRVETSAIKDMSGIIMISVSFFCNQTWKWYIPDVWMIFPPLRGGHFCHV